MGALLGAACDAVGRFAITTSAFISNDALSLRPLLAPADRVLEFDFPGFRVGCAEYAEGPTGCTVFHFPERATAVADIRGGLHASIYMDYLPHQKDVIDAICLAGGSLYGLEAATGVTAELMQARQSLQPIAKVTGAICFDFWNRDNAIYPDKELGRAALRAAQPGWFPLGANGAGRNVGCGGGARFANAVSERAGQGGAFRSIGPTKIAVFTVVNALGAIVNRAGEVVRGNYVAATGTRHHYHELLQQALGASTEPPIGNTTLTVVVTNQRIQHLDLFARQVHSSMARAIQPFHTEVDGDILYAVSTDAIDNPALGSVALGAIAAELAWDAVLSSWGP